MLTRGSVFVGAVIALVLGAAVALSPTAAAPVEAQGPQVGLINVSIGPNNVLNNANVGVAVPVVANLCPNINVGQIAILALAAARTGNQQTVCTATGGPVTISRA